MRRLESGERHRGTSERGLTFVVSAENLLNRQRGEPDNVTIIAGRTITTGLKVSFY